MTDLILTILNNPAVDQRVSAATRRVLNERVKHLDAPRFLPAELYAGLQRLVDAILPQAAIGTEVDIAGAIDKRLADGKGSGWRLADLPVDGKAYVQGLTAFAIMLQQTSPESFDAMPSLDLEEYLRSAANGDVDSAAGFPLSKWLQMVKTDAVRAWLSHPAAMEKIEYYGFADGLTGTTNGPTAVEGWTLITPNTAMPFEQGAALTKECHEEA